MPSLISLRLASTSGKELDPLRKSSKIANSELEMACECTLAVYSTHLDRASAEGRGVLLAGLNTVAEEFAYPSVPRNGGQTLVQEVLEAAMVSANDELPCPKVSPPVPNGVHKANKLPFVGGQFSVLGPLSC
jgi:hypothetical protein